MLYQRLTPNNQVIGDPMPIEWHLAGLVREITFTPTTIVLTKNEQGMIVVECKSLTKKIGFYLNPIS